VSPGADPVAREIIACLNRLDEHLVANFAGNKPAGPSGTNLPPTPGVTPIPSVLPATDHHLEALKQYNQQKGQQQTQSEYFKLQAADQNKVGPDESLMAKSPQEAGPSQGKPKSVSGADLLGNVADSAKSVAGADVGFRDQVPINEAEKFKNAFASLVPSLGNLFSSDSKSGSSGMPDMPGGVGGPPKGGQATGGEAAGGAEAGATGGAAAGGPAAMAVMLIVDKIQGKLEAFLETMTKTTVAMVELPGRLYDFSDSVLKANRATAEVSTGMAQVFAQSDFRDMMRDMNVGERTAGTAGGLADSMADLKDSIAEIKILMQNILNVVAQQIVRALTIMADGVGEGLDILQGLLDKAATLPVIGEYAKAMADELIKMREGEGVGTTAWDVLDSWAGEKGQAGANSGLYSQARRANPGGNYADPTTNAIERGFEAGMNLFGPGGMGLSYLLGRRRGG
jgi:hypothetical protein